jgi:hypothetical protein
MPSQLPKVRDEEFTMATNPQGQPAPDAAELRPGLPFLPATTEDEWGIIVEVLNDPPAVKIIDSCGEKHIHQLTQETFVPARGSVIDRLVPPPAAPAASPMLVSAAAAGVIPDPYYLALVRVEEAIGEAIDSAGTWWGHDGDTFGQVQDLEEMLNAFRGTLAALSSSFRAMSRRPGSAATWQPSEADRMQSRLCAMAARLEAYGIGRFDKTEVAKSGLVEHLDHAAQTCGKLEAMFRQPADLRG